MGSLKKHPPLEGFVSLPLPEQPQPKIPPKPKARTSLSLTQNHQPKIPPTHRYHCPPSQLGHRYRLSPSQGRGHNYGHEDWVAGLRSSCLLTSCMTLRPQCWRQRDPREQPKRHGIHTGSKRATRSPHWSGIVHPSCEALCHARCPSTYSRNRAHPDEEFPAKPVGDSYWRS